MDVKERIESFVMPPNEFIKLRMVDRKPIIKFWLKEGQVYFVVGEAGVGKTRFTMELATAIYQGRDCFPGAENGRWKVVMPVKPLYIDGEMPHEMLTEIAEQAAQGGKQVPTLSKIVLMNKEVEPSLNLNSEEMRDIIYKILIDGGYGLVVLDNVFTLWEGLNHKDEVEWSPTNQWFLKLRSKNIAVIISDHLNKASDLFGTITKRNAIDNLFLLEKSTKEVVRKGAIDGEESDIDCASFCINLKNTGVHTLLLKSLYIRMSVENEKYQAVKRLSRKNKMMLRKKMHCTCFFLGQKAKQ
ncbi:MAG: AAA family ATPase [Planctomycetota bacterium]|jgi:hypothetical protein